MEAQCARCGSSTGWVECWNCDEGYVESDFGDGIVEDIELVACDICDGKGGFYTCLSDEDWCEAHPLPGREKVASGTADTFEADTRVSEDKPR